MHRPYARYATTWPQVCTYVRVVLCTHVASHMHQRESRYAPMSGEVCTDVYLDPAVCKISDFRPTPDRWTIAATSGHYGHRIPLPSAIVTATAYTLAAISHDFAAAIAVVVPFRVCTHIMRCMHQHGSGYARTSGWYAPMSHSICTHVNPGMHPRQERYALTSI